MTKILKSHFKQLAKGFIGICFLLLGFISVAQSSGYNIKLSTPKELQQFLRYTGDKFYLLSSHRGGPEKCFPENCIATFENTLKYTPAILEVDPRYTKDSVIILHHDPDLKRTTNGEGKVADFTWKELQKLQLKDIQGNLTEYKIPTLKEALSWAKGKAILLLDKKDVPVAARVKLVEQCNAEAFTIVMVYNFKEAQECYQLNNNIMMQVFMGTPEKVKEFEKTGVPWQNVVAFVGHTKPKDRQLMNMIHKHGTLCIMGTSRNLDKELSGGKVNSVTDLKENYNALFLEGIDVLETDIPVEVSKVLQPKPTQSLKMKFLNE